MLFNSTSAHRKGGVYQKTLVIARNVCESSGDRCFQGTKMLFSTNLSRGPNVTDTDQKYHCSAALLFGKQRLISSNLLMSSVHRFCLAVTFPMGSWYLFWYSDARGSSIVTDADQKFHFARCCLAALVRKKQTLISSNLSFISFSVHGFCLVTAFQWELEMLIEVFSCVWRPPGDQVTTT